MTMTCYGAAPALEKFTATPAMTISEFDSHSGISVLLDGGDGDDVITADGDSYGPDAVVTVIGGAGNDIVGFGVLELDRQQRRPGRRRRSDRIEWRERRSSDAGRRR